MAENKIIEWVKSHPYQTGIALFAIGAVIIFSRSGSSSTASNANGGALTSQQLALYQQQEQAQLQANQLAGQLNLANIQAEVQQHQIDNALAATKDTNATNIQINQQNTQAAVQTTALTTGAQVQTAQAADQAQVAIAGYNAQTQQIVAQSSAQAIESVAKLNANASMFGSGLSFLGNLL